MIEAEEDNNSAIKKEDKIKYNKYNNINRKHQKAAIISRIQV
jgi:hypothetical protein